MSAEQVVKLPRLRFGQRGAVRELRNIGRSPDSQQTGGSGRRAIRRAGEETGKIAGAGGLALAHLMKADTGFGAMASVAGIEGEGIACIVGSFAAEGLITGIGEILAQGENSVERLVRVGDGGCLCGERVTGAVGQPP